MTEVEGTYEPADNPRPETQWRDPDRLEHYLVDDLEEQPVAFRSSARAIANMVFPAFFNTGDSLLLPETDQGDAAQALVQRRLGRLSPKAAGFYADAWVLLNEQVELASTRHLIAHLIRELDGSIRDIWWSMMCFTEQAAADTRLAGKNAGGRDAPHATQIGMLSQTLGLTAEQEALWRNIARRGPELTHRGKIGETSPLSVAEDELFRSALSLMEPITLGAERAFGFAILRAAELIHLGPSSVKGNFFPREFPYHPELRRWFMAQVKDPNWIPLLAASDMLRADGVYFDETDTLIVPACPGARLIARLGVDVRAMPIVGELIAEWLSLPNPRLHTDVIQIMLAQATPIYLDHMENLLGWLKNGPLHDEIVRVRGNAGVLRYPSHCLRLAVRAHRDHNERVASRLVQEVKSALEAATEERDHDHLESQLELCLLGTKAFATFDELQSLVTVLLPGHELERGSYTD